MLGSADAEAKRLADLVNRSAFVVSKGERRALERTQALERLPNPRLDLGATGQAFWARVVTGGERHGLLQAFAA